MNGRIGRDKAKVGEVPGQVVGGHADEREAPRAVDGVDAAHGWRRAALQPSVTSRGFEQRVVENEFALVFDRAGHQHMVVGGAPLDR